MKKTQFNMNLTQTERERLEFLKDKFGETDNSSLLRTLINALYDVTTGDGFGKIIVTDGDTVTVLASDYIRKYNLWREDDSIEERFSEIKLQTFPDGKSDLDISTSCANTTSGYMVTGF